MLVYPIFARFFRRVLLGHCVLITFQYISDRIELYGYVFLSFFAYLLAVNGIIKRRASAHRFIWSFMFVDKGVHVLK